MGKHPGMKLENKPGSIVTRYEREMCTIYTGNNELMQEFCYAHSTTKTMTNSIYISHFTGSVLSELFGHEVEMITIICIHL